MFNFNSVNLIEIGDSVDRGLSGGNAFLSLFYFYFNLLNGITCNNNNILLGSPYHLTVFYIGARLEPHCSFRFNHTYQLFNRTCQRFNIILFR